MNLAENAVVADTTPAQAVTGATPAPDPDAQASAPGSTLFPPDHPAQAPDNVIHVSSGRPRGRPRGPNYGKRNYAKENKLRAQRVLNPDEPPKAPDGGPAYLQRDTRPVDYDAMGKMCVDVVTGTATQFLGPDWKPEDVEHETLSKATATYLRAKQFPDVPPGWVLCFVVFAYSIKRLQMPDTQSRIGRLKHKIKGAFRMGKRGPVEVSE